MPCRGHNESKTVFSIRGISRTKRNGQLGTYVLDDFVSLEERDMGTCQGVVSERKDARTIASTVARAPQTPIKNTRKKTCTTRAHTSTFLARLSITMRFIQSIVFITLNVVALCTASDVFKIEWRGSPYDFSVVECYCGQFFSPVVNVKRFETTGYNSAWICADSGCRSDCRKIFNQQELYGLGDNVKSYFVESELSTGCKK
ncbi:MAG: hypothetical protein BYD32DRAFT_434340 [Podila humilis]|nr:MAG: hypothetical protein BYD32DRAFT_434340 [Podila humilis]